MTRWLLFVSYFLIASYEHMTKHRRDRQKGDEVKKFPSQNMQRQNDCNNIKKYLLQKCLPSRMFGILKQQSNSEVSI